MRHKGAAGKVLAKLLRHQIAVPKVKTVHIQSARKAGIKGYSPLPVLPAAVPVETSVNAERIATSISILRTGQELENKI